MQLEIAKQRQKFIFTKEVADNSKSGNVGNVGNVVTLMKHKNNNFKYMGYNTLPTLPTLPNITSKSPQKQLNTLTEQKSTNIKAMSSIRNISRQERPGSIMQRIGREE